MFEIQLWASARVITSFVFRFLLFSDALLRVYVVMDSDAIKCCAEEQRRIAFQNEAVMIHSVHNGQCPAYLRDTVCTHTVLPVIGLLRGLAYAPPSTARYFVPRCGALGDTAFSIAGPRTWNDLPSQPHAVTDFKLFKKLLKTHYFKSAFKQLL